MNWETVGCIGLACTLLLTFLNAMIRDRERRRTVTPWVKYPLAWLRLLMIPAGVIVVLAGFIATEGIRDNALLNMGVALFSTGLAGFPAMNIGGVLRRKAEHHDMRTTIWVLLCCQMLAFIFWARTMAG
jgi:hypothetical protein